MFGPYKFYLKKIMILIFIAFNFSKDITIIRVLVFVVFKLGRTFFVLPIFNSKV